MSDDDMSVAEARALLRDQAKGKGADCPVCRRFTKVYKRSIHTAMARGLITIWNTVRRTPFHMPTVLGINGGDTAKLTYWGLLYDEGEQREDGGRAGWWHVTDQGAAFAVGQLAVPKYALVYHSRCLGLDGPAVTIRDCLGDRFDLDELLGRQADDPPSLF